MDKTNSKELFFQYTICYKETSSEGNALSKPTKTNHQKQNRLPMLNYAEPVDPHLDPSIVVFNVFGYIQALKDELEIPMLTFEEASARLKRAGVSFIVKLAYRGKIVDVPFRVENAAVVHTQYCHERKLSSWRGNEIHSITVRVRHTIGHVFKRITSCLKAAFHRFQRKVNNDTHKNRLKRLKRDDKIKRLCIEQRCVH